MLKIETGKPLLNLNTFNVKSSAAEFVQINSVNELDEIRSLRSKFNDFLILGGGSNLLFVGDHEGLVLYPQLFGETITSEDTNSICLKVSASENWHDFVTNCLANGYYGLENLALIPGTVGAAPVQNIGAYGVEVESLIESVECFDLLKNQMTLFNHSECQFSYRDSRFKSAGQGRYLVCSVNFKLSKIFQPVVSYAPIKQLALDNKINNAKDVYDWVCRIRQEKLPDPSKLANAGSFFKNPVISKARFLELKRQHPNVIAYSHHDQFKIAAGWLIDNAGLKGKVMDGVGVHKKQALVIVNYHQTHGEKIWALAELIMHNIKVLYDIQLEPEVSVLGLKN